MSAVWNAPVFELGKVPMTIEMVYPDDGLILKVTFEAVPNCPIASARTTFYINGVKVDREDFAVITEAFKPCTKMTFRSGGNL